LNKETTISEGIFWAVIGGLICVLALRFGLGTFHAPGTGFVAFLAGLFAVAMGLIMILSNVAKRGRGKTSDAASPQAERKGPPSRLVYTMVLLVAYAILMEPLGYILSTLLVMFGLFFDWEKRNWPWSGFFSVATTVISYVVFETWLRCQLPRGIFPWW
jgi:putative tricarboxylic transport membrane protein